MIRIIIEIEDEGGPQASIKAYGQGVGENLPQAEKDMASKIMESMHAICTENSDGMLITGGIIDRTKSNG